ncbi:MAG TPA: hypothetical protein EYN03_05240, partial [Planctomycetes bacterium]|nr:hypothetical protein [Planctomycetota bacterium]
DTFHVTGGLLQPQGYNVVANDIEGTNGELTLHSFTQPVHGTVTDGGDGKHLLYEPDGLWFNMESFTYTVENPSGQLRTANVTVHVEPEVADNIVDFGVTFRDSSGVELTTNEVSVGDRFEVLVTVEDLQTTPEGVFSAYMDLLYDRDHVSVVAASAVTCGNVISGIDFGICFDGEYTSLVHGSADKPGLIDEVGALRPIITPPGDVGAVELYVVTFQANVAGTAVFKIDPADEAVFETTVYGLLNAVDAPEIHYDFGQVVILAAGSPEGEPLDTNGDGAVTPMDALNVINDLNQNGSRAIGSGGEGETAMAEARLDVNRDQFISPADALMLINYLNGVAAEAAQTEDAPLGEGEGAVPIMGPQPTTQSSSDDDKSTDAAELETDLFAEAILPTVDPARNQQTLSESATSLTSQDRVFASLHDDAAGEADSLLDDLATDVCQAWLS